MKKLLSAALTLLFFAGGLKAEKSEYMPHFYGQIRARFEYLAQQDVGAFQVRTLRLGVDGNIVPSLMTYCAEIEFSDWGKFGLINAFLKFTPVKDLGLQIGQARMPFTLSAHRQPWEQYFSNRNFVAKYGGVRDIGFVGSYTLPKLPLTLQASVFNCSGTGEHKDFFTKDFGFSAKIISPFLPNWYATASTSRLTKTGICTQNWDVGGFFDNGLWHAEAEYLRKQYAHGVAAPVNAFDLFLYRKFSIEKKLISNVSGAVRYDYMSNLCSGATDDSGHLIVDDPERHRLTIGATLTFQSKFQPYIRLNYEKYFYNKNIVPSRSADDCIVLEVVAHF